MPRSRLTARSAHAALSGPEIAIGAELGRQTGRNLFHSFERFSLATGERATFSGPDQIQNVISRVTGGERSEIDGTIRSTMPNADFYFINPLASCSAPTPASISKARSTSRPPTKCAFGTAWCSARVTLPPAR